MNFGAYYKIRVNLSSDKIDIALFYTFLFLYLEYNAALETKPYITKTDYM